MPSLLILLPFLILMILNLPFKNITRKAGLWFTILLASAQVVLVFFHPVLFWSTGADPLISFFAFKFSIDNLSLILLLTIGIVVFVSALVAWNTIPNERQRFNFTNLLLTALIGMNAIVMVNDLFSLYVFIEITAISSFILIALLKDRLALEGAFKYIMLSAVASIMMISSVALLMFISGDTSFIAISTGIKAASSAFIVKLAIALFLCGLFIKSGLVPFHGWLPDAYSSAPSATSVLLAGIITKVSGVYVLIRVMLSVFGFTVPLQNILMLIGMISIITGALCAFGQDNFKRMLAYSSISQVGYIILGLGCGTPLAIAGAVFHLFNHAIFKSLLFVNASAVEQRIGTVSMDKMGGLAQRMPYTGTTSIIAFLSTAGVPPLSGFWSKFIIVLSLWQANNHLYAVLALLASILTLAYFLSMQRRVFFGKLKEGLENIHEASIGLILPSVLLASITVGIGIFFPFLFGKFLFIFKNIMG